MSVKEKNNDLLIIEFNSLKDWSFKHKRYMFLRATSLTRFGYAHTLPALAKDS